MQCEHLERPADAFQLTISTADNITAVKPKLITFGHVCWTLCLKYTSSEIIKSLCVKNTLSKYWFSPNVNQLVPLLPGWLWAAQLSQPTKGTPAFVSVLHLLWRPLKVSLWKINLFLRDFSGEIFSKKACLLLALDHMGIDALQLALQSHLVNTSERVRQKVIHYLQLWFVRSFIRSYHDVNQLISAFPFQPVSSGRCPTEYNRTGFRFQDPSSLKWFYLTLGVAKSTLDDFIWDAPTRSSTE